MSGIFHIVLFLGIIALTTYGIIKAKANKKSYTFSLILTVLTTLIPMNGNPSGPLTYYYFGFPSKVLEYYGELFVTFNPIGYLFNLLLFYLLIRLLAWCINIFVRKPSNQQ